MADTTPGKEDFKKELAAKRRQLTQAQRRMEELDRLFKRLYEDNISGKINDSRFEKLSVDYENEQTELTEKMQLLEQEIAQQEASAKTPNTEMTTCLEYVMVSIPMTLLIT